MIDFEVRGRTAVVTINRPAARNAVNGAVAVGLRDAVQRIEAEHVLREPGGAVAAAVEPAARIGANAPVAVQLSRAVMLAAAAADDEEAWRISEAAGAAVARTEDFAEGPRAFVEKRPPVWTGH